jgi:hypothetical protein
VSQQLAHMLRAGREEEEGAGRDSPALLLLADRHRELNRHLFLADRSVVTDIVQDSKVTNYRPNNIRPGTGGGGGGSA